MTDPLVTRYLPVLRGMIIKKYSWVETRGNCLLTVDDLIQVASIRLIDLVSRWDGILAGMGKERDGDGALFWTFLRHETKQAILAYWERVAPDNQPLTDSFDDHLEDEDSWADVRTSLMRLRDPSIIHADIADYFTTIPQRDKVIITLRYFDDLPWATVADVLGIAAASAHAGLGSSTGGGFTRGTSSSTGRRSSRAEYLKPGSPLRHSTTTSQLDIVSICPSTSGG